ncbi:MAG: hypothetical protein WBE18_01995 [Gammaproteobacteria bacterium]
MFRTISSALLATAVSVFALNAYADPATDTSGQAATTMTTTQTAPADTSTTTKPATKHHRHHAKKHKEHNATTDQAPADQGAQGGSMGTQPQQ